MKRPTNKSEVRAILGLINYYGRFFKNLSDLLYPLNCLLQDKVPFHWNDECEKAFSLVKCRIQSDDVLCHFDSNLPITVASDASSYACGAVISHVFPDGTERPIQFASQTLTKTQQKYAQIDKEAYAIIFAIKKFYQYLYGRRFILICDHKPLVQIFNPDKSIPVMSATRMQHYALFLQGFSYDIRYRNTKEHGNADAMSRLPLCSEDTHMFDETDVFQIQNIETLPLTVKDIATHTKSDKLLQPLLSALETGKLIDSHLRFHINQDEFSLQSGCIMRGIRVVIPTTLQYQVLQELHLAHFGISKMKSLARSYCWWSRIDADIEELARGCDDCNRVANNPVKVITHPWEPPAFPFDRIHIDFAGPFRNFQFLIIVDAYSKWPEVFKVSSTTSDNTMRLLRLTFARYGIPCTLVSDNASTFTSDAFKQFLKNNNIVHKTIAPYHPATNGQVERYVQTLKNALNAMENEGDLDFQLARLLMHYRRTPHSTTNVSPSVLMFGRQIRSRLDFIKPLQMPATTNPTTATSLSQPSQGGTSQSQIPKEVITRDIPLNERVAARSYMSKKKWEFGVVVRKLGKLNYEIQLDDGRIWKRHIDQIRQIGGNRKTDALSVPSYPAPTTQDNTPETTRLIPDNETEVFERTRLTPDSSYRERNSSFEDSYSTFDDSSDFNHNTSVQPDMVLDQPNLFTEDYLGSSQPQTSPRLRRSTRIRRSPDRYGWT